MSEANEEKALDDARSNMRKAEMRLLRGLTETFESAAMLYWPDSETGRGVGVDKTVMDAIADNLPFQQPCWPPFETLEELFEIQHVSRLLATYNEFGKGALKNRKNFVVGYGHTISVAAKPGFEITESEKIAINGVLRDFERRNRWRQRQRATQFRLDRDGEVFRRKFKTADGLVLRFIEPEDVRAPDMEKEAAPFGIVFAPGDTETALGYWLRKGDQEYELVAGDDVQHVKLDDDMGCPRGLPLLMAAQRSLGGASAIQRNTVALTKIQSHFAALRKHQNAVMSAIQSAVAGSADVAVKNPVTGQTKYGKEYGPGGVYDVPGGVEMEFPSQGSKPENFMPPREAALRSAAASVVMPEYMFTADAANANFASTMVAEGPAVREFEAAQWDLIDADRELLEEELDLAVERGVISAELRERVEIEIDPPSPAVTNAKEAAEVRLLDQQIGASPQTLLRQAGYDYEREQGNNEEHVERTGGVPGPAFPLMNNTAPEPKTAPAPPAES